MEWNAMDWLELQAFYIHRIYCRRICLLYIWASRVVSAKSP